MRCKRCREPLKVARTGRRRRYCSDACRQTACRRRRKPSKLSVHFSSATCEWATPQDLFDRLHAIHQFTLDPCATAENAKCAAFFTKEQDGLQQPWHGRVWLNPPYGRSIGLWMAKAKKVVLSGEAELVVALVPSRTDTRWWNDHVKGAEVQFLQGRLRFGDAKTNAPFPSALVTFRDTSEGVEVSRNGSVVTAPQREGEANA
jgi:site-specific DNA-methyltransferase (adenine-specific)